MNDYQRYWAFRYRDTGEPAMIVFSEDADLPISDDHVKLLVSESPMLARKMKYNQPVSMVPTSVRMNEAELDMWLAFELCPVLRIYLVDPSIGWFRTEQIKP